MADIVLTPPVSQPWTRPKEAQPAPFDPTNPVDAAATANAAQLAQQPSWTMPPEAKQAWTMPDEARDTSFTVPPEAKAAHDDFDSLDTKSPEDLAKDPSFRPTEIYNKYKNTLSTAQVEKLGNAYKHVSESWKDRLTFSGAAKAVGSTLGSLGRGAVDLAWISPDLLFGNDPEAVRNNPEKDEIDDPALHAQRLKEAEDTQKSKAEALAALEAGGLSAASMARSGLRKAYNSGLLSKIAELSPLTSALAGGLKPPVETEADILKGPKSFATPVDWTQRLLDDAALEEQQAKTEQAEGPVAKAAGLDAETLAAEGITVNPDTIRDLSSVENPINLLPLGGEFILASAGGKVLARSVSEDALRGLVTKVGGTIAKTGKLVTKGGSKLGTLSSAGVGQFIESGLTHGVTGTGPILGASIPTALKVAGKALTFVGDKVLSPELVTPVLNFGLKTAAGGAEGAAIAAPFAAAQDYPEDSLDTLASGAALGSVANVASRGARAAKDIANSQVEKIVSSAYRDAPDSRPVAEHPAYGTDAELDDAHAGQMRLLEQEDPSTANVVNRLRAVLQPLKSELYLLPRDVFAKRLNLKDDANLPRGAKLDLPPNSDGTPAGTRLYIRQDGNSLDSLWHEPGHAIVQALPDNIRERFFNEIRTSYTPEQFAKFKQDYDGALPDGAKNLDENGVLHEVSAELLSAMLRGVPLDGTPVGLRQKTAVLASSVLQSLGIYNPDLGVPEGERGPTVTKELGVGVSPRALSVVEPFVRQTLSKADIQPPRPPVIADVNKTANVSPISALPEEPPANVSDVAPLSHFPEEAGVPPVIPEALTTVPSESLTPAHDQLLKQVEEKAPPEAVQSLKEIREKILSGSPLNPGELGIWEDFNNAANKLPNGDAVTIQKAEPSAPGEPIPPAPESVQAPKVNPEDVTPAVPQPRPNLRGITPESYKPFEGAGRSKDEIGLTETSAAVAKNPDLSDEAKQAFQTLSQNVRRPVQVTYRSAETAGDLSRTARRSELESARHGENTRIDEGVGKVGVPVSFRVTKGGIEQVQFFSPDKVLANARDLISMAEAAKASDLIPYESEAGKLTPAGEDAFHGDLENYLSNQDNGFRGDGKKLVRPAGQEGFIPEENPQHTPVSIPSDKADFINATMALKQPQTNRVQVDKVTKQTIKPTNVRAYELVKANEKQALQPGDITPANVGKQVYENFGGQSISEFNPLRKKLDEAGVKTRELSEATEWTNVRDIKSATPLPENRLAAGVPLLATANLMPARTEAGKGLEKKGFSFVPDSDPEDLSLKLRNKRGSEVAQITVARRGKKEAYIDTVTVKPAYQKQGIAEALYRELAARLQDEGINKLTGEVIHDAPEKIRRKLFGEPTSFDEDTGDITSRINSTTQFMPAKGIPAIRMSDGKVFSSEEDLYSARMDAVDAGYNDTDLDKSKDGRLVGKKFVEEEPYEFKGPKVKAGHDLSQKIWVKPDGEITPISGTDNSRQLTGDYHNGWLHKNQPALEKQFGWPKKGDLKPEMRAEALKRGFVRVAYETSGRLAIEANKNKFPKSVRDSLMELIKEHAGKIGSVTVNLYNNKGDLTHNLDARLVGMSNEEKLNNIPILSDGSTQFMPTRELANEEHEVADWRREDAVRFMPVANKGIRQLAEDYMKSAGIEGNLHESYVKVNEPLAKKIADFYQGAEHTPNDPAVKASYRAFMDETKAQWDAITASGVTMEPWLEKGQPYKDSAEMLADLKDNDHLYFFPTENGFGTGGAESNHPLLSESGIEAGGVPLTVNDLFRAVHDYFGHGKEGYGFGPQGEYNAFLSHAKMYSDEARPAMAAGTLGQNSWVNFGPHLRDEAGSIPAKGEKGFVPLQDRPFADQKATVLPAELTKKALNFMPARRGQQLHSEDLNELPPKFWLDKSGSVLDAGNDHAKFAAKTLGEKMTNDTREQVVSKLMDRGALRGQKVDDVLHLEGTALNFSDLSKAQRNAIEGLSGQVAYNGELLNDPGTVQFMPSKNPDEEHIKQAAVQLPDGRVFTGGTHSFAYDEAEKAGVKSFDGITDGFITSKGKFVDRDEAYKMANKAQQITPDSYEASETKHFGGPQELMVDPKLESVAFNDARKFMPENRNPKASLSDVAPSRMSTAHVPVVQRKNNKPKVDPSEVSLSN